MNKIFGYSRHLIQSCYRKHYKMVRFFPNNLPDYNIGELKVKELEIKALINTIVSQIIERFPPTEENAEDGIYLGTAGVAYMFYHLRKVSDCLPEKYFTKAIEYIKPALATAVKNENKTKDLPSFLLGNAGIYATAFVLYDYLKNPQESERAKEKYLQIASICKNPFLTCGDDELFVGRAGYICGALWMAKTADIPLPIQDLYDICNAIVRSGRNYSKSHMSSSPLMYAYYNVEYLGAAHGLCTILQMLLSVPGYLEAFPDAAKDIRASVDYLLNLQTENGNFPCATDEIGHRARKEKDELVHWCHGAPGVVYLMAKAYILWSDEKYLNSCEKCVDLIWERGLLFKGPGICHGVAGNGYVFLLLYRLTGEEKYLHRAKGFSYFMMTDEFKKNSRMPDNPYSLYEGIAGTACFLADVLHPDSAEFPFFNVF